MRRLLNLRRLILLVILLSCMLSVTGCRSISKRDNIPQVWWGKRGDFEKYEEGKKLVEKYDWILFNQDLIKQ